MRRNGCEAAAALTPSSLNFPDHSTRERFPSAACGVVELLAPLDDGFAPEVCEMSHTAPGAQLALGNKTGANPAGSRTLRSIATLDPGTPKRQCWRMPPPVP